MAVQPTGRSLICLLAGGDSTRAMKIFVLFLFLGCDLCTWSYFVVVVVFILYILSCKFNSFISVLEIAVLLEDYLVLKSEGYFSLGTSVCSQKFYLRLSM